MQALPARLTLGLIHIYQSTLSPDHGPLKALFPYGACRFSPTCSQYAADAVRRRGAVVGLSLFVARLSRCHPYSQQS